MSAPFRIAHVIETLGAGGAEMLLADVAERLDRSRFESRVLPLEPPLDVMPRLMAAAVAVEPVLRSPRRRPVACVVRLGSQLRAWRPQVVHTHLYFANVLGRLAALRIPSAAVVTTLHNPDYTFEARSGPVFAVRKALDRLTASRNAAFVAVSRAVADDFQRHMGWPDIDVIHNGVDLQRYLPGPADPVPEAWRGPGMKLLTVGRLHAQKGHDVLLEAVAAGLRQGVPLSLAVVGDGPLRAALEEQARRLHIEGCVQFLGVRKDVPALLRAADAFVFPSRYEAFGVALLEAMACGKAVVASRAGGIVEVVEDGVSGLLVPVEDVAALAGSLALLAGDAELRGRLGRQARCRAQQFDIARTVSRLDALYTRLLAGRPR